MDFTAPISRFMTRKLVTVMPSDRLTKVKEIFDNNRIHHIPVVNYTTLVGLISKSDLIHFLKGAGCSPYDDLIEHSRLHHFTAEEVMTSKLAILSSSDRINVALEVFTENLFHAIPVVDDGELVGILTTFDIIKALMEEDFKRMKSN